MTNTLEQFLELLAMDGNWHGLDEVSSAMNLSRDKVEKIARFFARYSFILFDEEKRVRIDIKLRKLYVLSPDTLAPAIAT